MYPRNIPFRFEMYIIASHCEKTFQTVISEIQQLPVLWYVVVLYLRACKLRVIVCSMRLAKTLSFHWERTDLS